MDALAGWTGPDRVEISFAALPTAVSLFSSCILPRAMSLLHNPTQDHKDSSISRLFVFDLQDTTRQAGQQTLPRLVCRQKCCQWL